MVAIPLNDFRGVGLTLEVKEWLVRGVDGLGG